MNDGNLQFEGFHSFKDQSGGDWHYEFEDPEKLSGFQGSIVHFKYFDSKRVRGYTRVHFEEDFVEDLFQLKEFKSMTREIAVLLKAIARYCVECAFESGRPGEEITMKDHKLAEKIRTGEVSPSGQLVLILKSVDLK